MSAQQTNLGIVVGVDGSPCSHTAVEWAARDAQMRNVALRVVQVVPPVITAPEGWAFEYSRFQEAQKREIVEHSYLVAQAHQIVEQAHKVALEASSSGRAAQITGEVLHGQIVPTLANISRQVAMVVLGYRGQGAVAGALLGSVSSSLVRHAHGPVAVIPEEPRPARPPHAPVVVGIDGSPTSGLAAEIAFDEASRRGVDLRKRADHSTLHRGLPRTAGRAIRLPQAGTSRQAHGHHLGLAHPASARPGAHGPGTRRHHCSGCIRSACARHPGPRHGSVHPNV
ncbi:universal stress protein [Mycobacterium tuberculosis XTB13-178]|nr:universal stress protein [Mycobacterium tuberculosis XTB13-178]